MDSSMAANGAQKEAHNKPKTKLKKMLSKPFNFILSVRVSLAEKAFLNQSKIVKIVYNFLKEINTEINHRITKRLIKTF